MILTDDRLKTMLAEAVRRSGFPFQARIQSLLEASAEWHLLGSEISWKAEDREEFLDIVACRDTLVAVIECKRFGTTPDAKRHHEIEVFAGAPKRCFVFLCTKWVNGELAKTTRTLVWSYLEANPLLDPPLEPGLHGDVLEVAPACEESSLCVTFDVHERRELLERDLSLLVRGTFAYARMFCDFTHSAGGEVPERFLSVYVTTAPLFALKFDPDKVSEVDGNFEIDTDSLIRVPWIRFTKALMASGTVDSDERTVFVVESRHFKDFLNQLKSIPKPRRRTREG